MRGAFQAEIGQLRPLPFCPFLSEILMEIPLLHPQSSTRTSTYPLEDQGLLPLKFFQFLVKGRSTFLQQQKKTTEFECGGMEAIHTVSSNVSATTEKLNAIF